MLLRIIALIFKNICTYRSVSWSEDTDSSKCLYTITCSSSRGILIRRFSEAIHVQSFVKLLIVWVLLQIWLFFLVYIPSLYTKTIFKQDLPCLMTILQICQIYVKWAFSGRNVFDSWCNIARLNEMLTFFSLSKRE